MSSIFLRVPLPAAALLLVVSACSPGAVRPPQASAADAALVARIERAFSDDPRLFARHIDVGVVDGTVYLSGYVWSTHDLYAAQRIAAAVPGVARVNSELELMVGGRNGR